MIAFIDSPSFGEILMIGFVALLVFGGKLPNVARDIGKKFSGLKRNVETMKRDLKREIDDTVEPAKLDPGTLDPMNTEDKKKEGPPPPDTGATPRK